MGHELRLELAYFGGEAALKETYVRYAEVVLEPKRAKLVEETESVMRKEINKLQKEKTEQFLVLTNKILELSKKLRA